MIPNRLLNAKVAIQSPTRTADSQGGHTISYSTVTGLGEVSVRIVPRSGNETRVGLREEDRMTHTIFFNLIPSQIKRGYRIVFNSRNFEVLRIREPSKLGHHIEVDVEEKIRAES